MSTRRLIKDDHKSTESTKSTLEPVASSTSTSPSTSTSTSPPPTTHRKRKVSFVLIFIFIWVLAYYLGLLDYLSLPSIKENRQLLLQSVNESPWLASIIYTLTYLVVVGFSIPGATILTMIGGIVFPQPLASILAIVGATLGALMLFSLVRTAFGTVFQRQVASNDKLYRKFTAMLDVNHLFLSLLICRIVPIFPFWLVNIAPALVDFVDVFTFVLSTFIGITPGSYLYTEVGATFGRILDEQVHSTIKDTASSTVAEATSVSTILWTLLVDGRLVYPVVIMTAWTALLVVCRTAITVANRRKKLVHNNDK